MLLFSHSIMSNSLWPHKLQYTRLSSPSQSPAACSNSCSLSRWCHPTILSSVVPFSPCLLSLVGHHVNLSWLFFKPAFMPGSITGRKSVINYNNLKGSYDWPPAVWLGSIKTFTTQTFGTCLSTDIICWPQRKVSVEIRPALGRHSALGKVAREDFCQWSPILACLRNVPSIKESVLWYSNNSPECKLEFSNNSFTWHDMLLYLKINHNLVTDTRIK